MGEWSKVRRYSVYRVRDEMPIIIYGTAKECAAALGIRMDSFFRQVSRSKEKKTNHGRYVVYEDQVEDLEE